MKNEIKQNEKESSVKLMDNENYQVSNTLLAFCALTLNKVRKGMQLVYHVFYKPNSRE